MKIYTSTFNAAKGQFISTSTEVAISLRDAVLSAKNLPTSANAERDARYASDSNHLYVYLNGQWLDQGYVPAGTVVTTPATPGSVATNLNIDVTNIHFKSSVASLTDLPSSNNVEDDAVFARDTNHLYVYTNSAWKDQGVFDISDIVENYIFQAIS